MVVNETPLHQLVGVKGRLSYSGLQCACHPEQQDQQANRERRQCANNDGGNLGEEGGRPYTGICIRHKERATSSKQAKDERCWHDEEERAESRFRELRGGT